jgi:hypothetical protein
MTVDRKYAGHEIIDILDFLRYICYNRSMRISKVIPEWVYELASISDSEAVQYAIALDSPDQLQLDGRDDKKVVLRYNDDILGYVEDVFYPSAAEIYMVDRGTYYQKVYVLWQGWNSQWYMTMCNAQKGLL